MHFSLISKVALLQGALVIAAPLAPVQLGGEGPVAARSEPLAVDGGVGPVVARDVGASADGSASVPILPRVVSVRPVEPIAISADKRSSDLEITEALDKRINEAALYSDSLGAEAGGLKKRTNEAALYSNSLGAEAGGLKRSVSGDATIEVSPRAVSTVNVPFDPVNTALIS